MDGKGVAWNGFVADRTLGASNLLHSTGAGFLGPEVKRKLVDNAIGIHAFEGKALERAKGEILGDKLDTSCNRKGTFECNMSKLRTSSMQCTCVSAGSDDGVF